MEHTPWEKSIFTPPRGPPGGSPRGFWAKTAISPKNGGNQGAEGYRASRGSLRGDLGNAQRSHRLVLKARWGLPAGSRRPPPSARLIPQLSSKSLLFTNVFGFYDPGLLAVGLCERMAWL